MAATYTAFFSAITFASSKSMGAVMNGAGSGGVVHCTRVITLNNQTTGVTGVLTTLELRRMTASSGGTTVTPAKHDTTNANLNANIVARSGGTDTLSDTFRRWMWSNDEPAVSSAVNDELECIVPLNEIWNSAVNDSAVQHLVSQTGEGVCVRHTGSSAVGIMDTIIEFYVV
jgi:hypothetical protein